MSIGYRRRHGRWSAAAIFITVLLVIASITINHAKEPSSGDFTYYDVVCLRAIDGDTIAVKGADFPKLQRVRLVGIDTPETVHPRKPVECYGKEASDYVKERVKGQHLRFAVDNSREFHDRYNRLLGYVFLPDGSFLNMDLVQLGYAKVYTKFPFYYKEEFLQAEREARSNKIGMWGKCDIK